MTAFVYEYMTEKIRENQSDPRSAINSIEETALN
jgi:hypothetical protein